MLRSLCFTFLALASVVHAQFWGSNHPSRQTPTQYSHQNLIRVRPGSAPLDPFSGSNPYGGYGGGGVVNPGAPFHAYTNGLTRVELWQRIDATWFLTQYNVLNHFGQALGDVRIWTMDLENRARGRQDVEWFVVSHYSNRPVRVWRDGTVINLTNYPFRLWWNPPRNRNGEWLDYDIRVGGASGDWHYRGFPVESLGLINPAHKVFTRPNIGSISDTSLFNTWLIAYVDNAAHTVSSTYGWICPTHQIAYSVPPPPAYSGAPDGFPEVKVSGDRLYPQFVFRAVLVRPDNSKVAVAEHLGGSAVNVNLFRNQIVSIDLRPHLNMSGQYRLEYWYYTPVGTGSGPGVGINPSFNGGWELVDIGGNAPFNVQLRIDVEGMMISG